MKKELLLCRGPSGALGIGTCVDGGPSAKRCTLPTAPPSSRQRPVNRGKPWSTALPRAGPRPSTQVASVPTAQRLSRRHSGRQPKCDGAHSFSDGAILAERFPSAKTSLFQVLGGFGIRSFVRRIDRSSQLSQFQFERLGCEAPRDNKFAFIFPILSFG
jgi:hypothetical protein